MTIKDLLVMVEQRFSIFPEPITDERLQEMLDGASLYHRDWSNRPDIGAISDILIEYNTDKPFNMRQLDKELPSGFHVFWGIAHYDDIVITYFQDKISAFQVLQKFGLGYINIWKGDNRHVKRHYSRRQVHRRLHQNATVCAFSSMEAKEVRQ